MRSCGDPRGRTVPPRPMCGEACERSVFAQLDPHAAVAARRKPDDAGREVIGKPVRPKPLGCGRLQQDVRLDQFDHRRDRGSPASVVRHFHDVGLKVDLASGMQRREARRRLRLDVAAVEQARSLLRLDRDDERCVVHATRSISRGWPQHAPSVAADLMEIARRRHLDVGSCGQRTVEQIPHCGVPPPFEERRMHDDAPYPGIAQHLGERAEVIEVRMADEQRVDHRAVPEDPWDDHAVRNGTARA